MSALFNFQSLLVVILLLICTCTYIHDFYPKFLNRYKTGFRGTFWKFARIGQRKSQYVALFCIGMAILMTRRTPSLNLIAQLHDEKLRSNRWQSSRSKYFQRRFDRASRLSSHDAKGHSGCVNALDFSSDGLLLASGGDDKRVLIWNMAETLFREPSCLPTPLTATHLSNIFSVKFDNHNRRVISAGNDEQILVHDIEKQQSNHSDELVDVFLESSPINCLAVQPEESQTFIAATDDGHIHLYDLRASSSTAEHDQPSIIVAESFDGAYHSCAFHPQQTCLVATANARQGIELYDIRLAKSAVLRYGAPVASSRRASNEVGIEGMSVTFNKTGTLLYALRRRLPPVLFKLHQSRAFCQFDADNYVNLCTMKAGCFAGDNDQYIVSGSDDFNVYLWRIPDYDDCQTVQRPSSSHVSSDHFVWNAHLILHGHRSVVNQVRYSSRLHTLVSSGVEKLIKIWTPYQTRADHCDRNRLIGREEMFSHRDYLRAVLESGSVHHDSSVEQYDEDRRMLAFFDSLLQRELRTSFNENDQTDDESDDLSFMVESSDDDDEDDGGDSSSSTTSQSEDQITLEEINRQTADLTDSIRPSTDPSDTSSARSRHPTIVSLAKNYRLHYVKMLRETMETSSSQSEKRALDSPTPPTGGKRSCPSSSTTTTLQTLRNRIRHEENEQFFFNDERRM